MQTTDHPTQVRAVSVNYHGLPDYLRKEAIARAKADLRLSLADLMRGRAEFGLSHRDPETERRAIVDVIRTTIA